MRATIARRTVLGALGAATLASLAGPRLRPRHEASFLRVRVSASFAGGMVAIFVRARNVHPMRRRVFTAWVDVAESIAAAGRLEMTTHEAAPRWVPIARMWRVPFVEEIAPGESRDLGLRIASARAGHYEGAVDVVLDGTSWVRESVGFDVPERRPGSGLDGIR